MNAILNRVPYRAHYPLDAIQGKHELEGTLVYADTVGRPARGVITAVTETEFDWVVDIDLYDTPLAHEAAANVGWVKFVAAENQEALDI